MELADTKSEKGGDFVDTLIFPIGIEDFTELRREGYYYVDKTGFISELLQKKFKVNLITRPRRFGKTLTMSMLADFLDIRKNSGGIFENLSISENKEFCRMWMNQWPVLFLSLKNIESLNFAGAFRLLKTTIADLCKKHDYLATSEYVDRDDKNVFLKMKTGEMDEAEIKYSLYTIMRMMQAHFGKQVVLLIDEYDVPLAKASENGYYLQMLDIVKGILGISLKTNEFLKFSVITGCLRIAKESIFTGTNNFVSSSISDNRFQKFFGFTEQEVLRILKDTGFTERAEQLKKWYNGYCFGDQEIYCPWDVLNYVNALQEQPDAKPENYWKNTSHNSIIRSFINRTDLSVNEKFEKLLDGQSIRERICEDLTYDVMHSSESNLWSVLYLTGYLTKEKKNADSRDPDVYLKIPNEEIRSIFQETVMEWFRETVGTLDRGELFEALWKGGVQKAAEQISDILFETISYHDYKESYYHAFMAGIFSGAGYTVESNYEYGLGRPDLVVKDTRKRSVLIIEVKYTDRKEKMGQVCREALEQINVKAYAEKFLQGYRNVLCYGIVFFQKECRIEKHIFTRTAADDLKKSGVSD